MGGMVVLAAPTIGFVALGPMWRNVVEPATNVVVDAYFCLSQECLEFNVASTTSMMSWSLKIFITTFGLLGCYLVRRWQWFQSVQVEETDDYGRIDLCVCLFCCCFFLATTSVCNMKND